MAGVQFNVGRTAKLGIQDSWVLILRRNEELKRKRTDQELADWMVREFPKHKSQLFEDLRKKELWRVQQARARYNRGAFTKGIVPKIKSHRYDKSGKTIDPVYSGKRGVRLTK